MSSQAEAALVELALRRQAEDDFYTFVKLAWPTVEGGKKLVDGWMLKAMAEHLEAVFYGRITRLLINLPPRMTKSTMVSVLFPVWCWIRQPSLQIFSLSYAERLAMRDNVKARRLIKSAWFQKRWGDRFSLSLDQDAKDRVDNLQGGYRVVAGMDGSITGDGGDCLVVGTPVLTTEGNVPIEVIAKNPTKYKVISYDFLLDMEVESDVIASLTRQRIANYEIFTSQGRSIRCTGNHKVYVKGAGFISASELRVEQRVYSSRGKLDRISAITVHSGDEQQVYDIQVKGTHNFFANGILVHNCLILDDPNNVRDQSEATLDSALSVFTDVLPTRFNDFKTGRMIVVQQRANEKDISGWILANEKKEWVHFMVPMEFEESRRCITVPLKSTKGEPWKDPRTEEGELLNPKRIGPRELKLLKSALSSEYSIAGQLQQRPAPAEGGMIKRAWWQPWKQDSPPNIRFVIQAWDTAMSIKDKAAYSACVTFGIFKDDHQHDSLILLSAWRKRVEFPDLYKAVQRMAKDYRATSEDRPINERYKPDLILVEEKASGIQLIQTLNKTGIILVGWRPDKYGDKVERVRRVTHLLEAGRVYVPYRGPDFSKPRQYADFLISQAALFPKGDGADLVDCTTMILQRVINSGWVLHPLEQEAAQQGEWRREYIGQEERGFY